MTNGRESAVIEKLEEGGGKEDGWREETRLEQRTCR
jgi:hypothetical protein